MEIPLIKLYFKDNCQTKSSLLNPFLTKIDRAMTQNFIARTEGIKKKFQSLQTPEKKYEYLIELGKKLPPYPSELKTENRIVPGCQSILYLDAQIKENRIYFQIDCDALISKGLGALLIEIYNGLSPQEILLNPPLFLKELGILTSLSPHRSNGLASIYEKMKKLLFNLYRN